MFEEMTQKIESFGVVPVVVLDDADTAVPYAEALIEGGLPVAEITFRTDAAEASIQAMAKAKPDMLVGAGTVSSVEQAQRALDAGAKFLVAPGINPTVVEFALKNETPIFPGALTPTDIELGLSLGLSVLKFFPAAAFGGLKTIKALSGPYGHVIRFMPTGGIDTGNLAEYLQHKNVIACGGSWLASPALIAAGQYEEIATLARDAVALARDARA